MLMLLPPGCWSRLHSAWRGGAGMGQCCWCPLSLLTQPILSSLTEDLRLKGTQKVHPSDPATSHHAGKVLVIPWGQACMKLTEQLSVPWPEQLIHTTHPPLLPSVFHPGLKPMTEGLEGVSFHKNLRNSVFCIISGSSWVISCLPTRASYKQQQTFLHLNVTFWGILCELCRKQKQTDAIKVRGPCVRRRRLIFA